MGFGFRVSEFGFRVTSFESSGFGSRVSGISVFGFRISGSRVSGFRISGFRVPGFGFRGLGLYRAVALCKVLRQSRLARGGVLRRFVRNLGFEFRNSEFEFRAYEIRIPNPSLGFRVSGCGFSGCVFRGLYRPVALCKVLGQNRLAQGGVSRNL